MTRDELMRKLILNLKINLLLRRPFPNFSQFKVEQTDFPQINPLCWYVDFSWIFNNNSYE